MEKININTAFLYITFLSNIFFYTLTEASLLTLFGSAPDQITKPYKPSFACHYPKTVSSLTGLSVYLIGSNYDNQNKSIIFTLSFVCTFLIHRFVKPSKIVDLLLLDPSAVNQNHNNIMAKFAKNDNDPATEENLTNELDLLKKIETKDPIVLLGECDTGNVFLGCELSRTVNKQYRERFESRLMQLSSNILCRKNIDQKSINMVSFGCGGLLQDLVFLTKLLTTYPLLTISLTLIDFKFELLAYLLKNDNHIFNINSINSINSAIETCEKEYTDISSLEIKNNIYIYYSMIKQFVCFLNNTFPSAQLSIAVYDTYHPYLSDIQNSNQKYPDLVYAVDIADGMSNPADYILFCHHLLLQKPFLPNIWLDKNCKISLRTIDLENGNGKEKFEINDSTCYIFEEIL